MEHAPGAAQAQHASEPEKTLHAVGAEQDSPVVWHFQASVQRCAEAGDWAGLSAATSALLAVTACKGKGGRGGKGGTGKGAYPTSTAWSTWRPPVSPGPTANQWRFWMPRQFKGKGKSGKAPRGG